VSLDNNTNWGKCVLERKVVEQRAADAAAAKVPPEQLSVLPNPGFVIKTRRANLLDEKKFFINVYHHPSVQDPDLLLAYKVLPMAGASEIARENAPKYLGRPVGVVAAALAAEDNSTVPAPAPVPAPVPAPEGEAEKAEEDQEKRVIGTLSPENLRSHRKTLDSARAQSKENATAAGAVAGAASAAGAANGSGPAPIPPFAPKKLLTPAPVFVRPQVGSVKSRDGTTPAVVFDVVVSSAYFAQELLEDHEFSPAHPCIANKVGR
jgi:hypothetical protein